MAARYAGSRIETDAAVVAIGASPYIQYSGVEHGDISSGDFLAVLKDGNDVTGAFSVGFDNELIYIAKALRETVE